MSKIKRYAFLSFVVLLMLSSLLITQAPGQAQRPTLPPTWTPTFTPTETLTPSPTFTPSPTPTVNPDVYCEETFYMEAPEPGASLPYNRSFFMVAGGDIPGTMLRVGLVHRFSGDEQLVEFDQPGNIGYNIPIRVLPRPGLYDWIVQLVDSDETVICEETGYFFAGRLEWLDPTPTPEEEENVRVVTATPEPPSQTPFIVVITATAEGTQPSIRERSSTTIPATAITPDG